MKVGDYVRTRDGFDRLVDKRKDDNHDYYWYRFENGKTMTNPENGFVIKSSPNIIDLIEVGDYVNGSKVIDIAQAPKRAIYIEDINQIYGLTPYTNDNIISIVTKEQFENCMYKIGEDK